MAILAEGYTREEMDSFYRHAEIAVESILSHEPFKSKASKFNFVAVATPSDDSGVSVLASAIGNQPHSRRISLRSILTDI